MAYPPPFGVGSTHRESLCSALQYVRYIHIYSSKLYYMCSLSMFKKDDVSFMTGESWQLERMNEFNEKRDSRPISSGFLDSVGK